MRHWIIAATAAGALAVAVPGAASAAPSESDVVETYADIAHTMYEDALVTARTLRGAIGRLAVTPSEKTMLAARAAWLDAREPYQQTEGYRFGNAAVDAWEGKVNAWPLDEGLIDYVDASYGESSPSNPYFTANIIANPTLELAGKQIDAETIDAELLKSLHELDGVEANVATGYHAIEFLLWGQDLHGTEAGMGERPWTDYSTESCTHGNCDRRAKYLTAATDLLIADLQDMVKMWAEGGEARAAVTDNPQAGIASMVKGLGSLSYGELAGERTKLGLMLHDPEEEHDCFADNTHNSHYYDQLGMMAIYQGRYVRVDGRVVSGASLSSLVAAKDKALDQEIASEMEDTLAKMQVMKSLADRRIMAYDQMLAAGNDEGNRVVQDVVDALVAQAKAIEKAQPKLGITNVAFEGSDSLDDPSAVFK